MPTDRRPRAPASTALRRISAPLRWDDLDLAPTAVAALQRIATTVTQNVTTQRCGTVLFTGPSGTGKTLAAQALAHAIGLQLYRIDLDRVVGKYIGETEKNLGRVFDAAERNGWMLLLDEADALFGKRSGVRDSHDRYANLDTSYLLQQLEKFSGLVILASNRKSNLDPAFLRRMRFAVDLSPTMPTEPGDLPHRPLPTMGAGRSNPGVYIDEVPIATRPITGVSTSITAFVGRTVTGPVDAPAHIGNFGDFERFYGGLSTDCPLSYAVRHYFENGGGEAIVARIVHRNAQDAVDESAPITDADIVGPANEAARRGLWMLDQVDPVNLVCIPPLGPGVDVAVDTWNTAIRYAVTRRAFVIIDPPAAWTSAADAIAGVHHFVDPDNQAAVYFPRVLAPNPLAADAPGVFAPCGAIAGLYARTDAQRGVWKAPAGLDAKLVGVTGLARSLTDVDGDALNRIGINALRNFPQYGNVVWGARTLAGADNLASEWKYVPVRRLALFIEESLFRGLAWVVFESNDEPLWARIRLNVGSFMHVLFMQGAFRGATPPEAYFVKCDRDTMTQSDIDLGIVNVLVGFAPVRPAEFLILKIALRAG